ncbi:MAG: hypothetical protein U1F36_17270 [Planctomycetota bacterium]
MTRPISAPLMDLPQVATYWQRRLRVFVRTTLASPSPAVALDCNECFPTNVIQPQTDPAQSDAVRLDHAQELEGVVSLYGIEVPSQNRVVVAHLGMISWNLSSWRRVSPSN